MLIQPSILTTAVSQLSPVVFALALSGFALWWRNMEQLEPVRAPKPERPVWELPPANAPPGLPGDFL